MKNSNNIIIHLKNQPYYKKIKNIECFNKIKSLLPPKLSNSILFIYIKNQTLFFVLTHPGYKMEFNYNVNLIKRLLKELKKRDKNCQNLNIKDIKTFVTNKINIQKTENNNKNSKIYYNERAKGNFKILTNNQKLKTRFLEIQKIIKD